MDEPDMTGIIGYYILYNILRIGHILYAIQYDIE